MTMNRLCAFLKNHQDCGLSVLGAGHEDCDPLAEIVKFYYETMDNIRGLSLEDP